MSSNAGEDGGLIRVGLSFSEWAFLASFISSFQEMLVDYAKTGRLEFPDHFITAAQSDQDHFGALMALVHNRLVAIADDDTRKIAPQPEHDPDILFAEYSPTEFSALWRAWRTTVLLFVQEVREQRLSMPSDALPETVKDLTSFNSWLIKALNKNPVVKLDRQASEQEPS